jgi:Fe-S-cluster-containing dehydrogenase component
VRDEYVGNAFPGYSRPHGTQDEPVLKIRRQVRGSGHHVDMAYQPVMCNHCDDAPCIAAAGGAIRKRADGIVLIDPDRARGRKDLVASCPYGAIVWNEAEQLPQHWQFDAHLLDAGWQAPRCVDVCPTQAIEAIKVEDDEMRARAQRDSLQVRDPELGTKPRVYYRNLHRMNRLFVAGSVVGPGPRGPECVSGATIRLDGPEGASSTVSDMFGDFKLDGLRAGPHTLTLSIDKPAFQPWQTQLTIAAESIVLDPITLATG